jgi:hypothetical protein
MPTASSTQIRNSATRIAPIKRNRCWNFLTFLITSSHMRPVPSNSTPMITKSLESHFTSFVNCIAVNGISNKSATVNTMPISLLFCVIINVMFLIVGLYVRFLELQIHLHQFYLIKQFTPIIKVFRKQSKAKYFVFQSKWIKKPSLLLFLSAQLPGRLILPGKVY